MLSMTTEPILLQIEWKDACSVSESGVEWMTKEDILKQAHEKYHEPCLSVGILVDENEDYIILAGTQYDTGQSYTDVTLIPKKMITSRKQI